MPVTYALRYLTVIVTVAALASGCASTSQVGTLFSAPGTPVQSLLLAARMPEPAQRRQWEQACLTELVTPGLTLVASHEALPDWYAGDNSALLQGVRDAGVDAVLVVELTGLLLAPMQLPPRNDVSEERFSGPPQSQPQRWQIQLGEPAREQPPAHLQFQARMLSADGTPRWEGVITTHEANQLQAIARSQCDALREALGRAALLP